ncbi:MAG: flagellar brake protein [Lautropia sp.]|nr:flagellar brake protein [Lautropia sp.]
MIVNTQPSADPMNAPLPGYLPLSMDESLAEFRVAGTMGVRSMLRELMSARAPVVLYGHEENHPHLITHVETLEANSFCLHTDAAPAHHDRLLNAHGLTLVGNTGAVKIQLELPSIALKDDEEGQHLVAAIPTEGWRIQRRNDFRVFPPSTDRASVFFRHADVTEGQGPIHDLSAGGLCFHWPDSLSLPKPGEMLRHCRIERDKAAALPCDLKVIRVAAGEMPGHKLVSCRFQGLPESMSRQIQIYVMDVERRQRNAG